MSLKKAVVFSLLATAITGLSLSANAATNSENITLNGTISSVTCEVTLNGGNAVLNVGNYAIDNTMLKTANSQAGDVELLVSLDNCSADSADGKGNLFVQGTNTTLNSNKTLFVGNSNTVGFMLKDSGSTAVQNNKAIPFDTKKDIANIYTFKVGMGVARAGDAAIGAYTAPIIIAYASE
nr:fimbrial protein [uncultured Moellerella sp.]